MDKYKFEVNFYLNREKAKASVKTPDWQIRASITFGGKRCNKYIGYRVSDEKWDESKQQMVKNTTNAKKQIAREVNDKIAEVRTACADVFRCLRVEGITPTPQLVLQRLNLELNDDNSSRKNIFYYYEQFLEERKRDPAYQPASYKKHRTIMHHVQKFSKSKNVFFEDITNEWFEKFKIYFVERDYRNNTTNKDIKIFKTFLNWAVMKGYLKTTDFREYRTKLKVVTNNEENMIVLEAEDFMRLYTMNLEDQPLYLQHVRDVFCFCAVTSLRYSDVAQLKWSCITKDGIALTTIKTKEHLVIPYNNFSLSILKKYEALKHTDDDPILHVISNQKYNKYIKRLCEKAGFDRPYVESYMVGNEERHSKPRPLYEVISSHCARRTFVTIALYLGIPAEVVMEYTGHKSHEVLELYYKIANSEKAKQMKKWNSLLKFTSFNSVFSYKITKQERKNLGILPEEEYNTQITNIEDRQYDVARLLGYRGKFVEAHKIIDELPDTMIAEWYAFIGLNKRK